MKHTAALVVSLFLLLLGSPLLAQEAPISPETQTLATGGATLPFMSEAIQSTSPNCAAATPVTGLDMKLRDCLLECGCCQCTLSDGSWCLDYQCC